MKLFGDEGRKVVGLFGILEACGGFGFWVL
jgi:hypothetical protein